MGVNLYTILSRRAEPSKIARAIRLVATDRVAYIRPAPGGLVGVVIGEKGEKHIVYLSTDGSRYSCTCYDFKRSGKPCKHVLALAFYVEKLLSRNLHHHGDAVRESRVHHPAASSAAPQSSWGNQLQ